MRIKRGHLGILLILALVVSFLVTSCSSGTAPSQTAPKTAPTEDKKEKPQPPPLPKVPVHKEVDHSKLIAKYDGPQTCEQCHPGKIEEVAKSLHYTFKAPVVNVEGLSGDSGKMAGRYCALPGSIPPINWLGILNPEKKTVSGCGLCHIGDGSKPTAQLSEAQKNGIDCLICHAKKYDMTKRTVYKDGSTLKLAQDRSLEAARTVGGVPTAEACLRCHNNAGGGPLYKRGTPFTPEADVHAARGLTCTDCHKTEAHRIAMGKVNDIWANELPRVEVSCVSCHSNAPHGEPEYNAHTARIACTTCHVGYVGGVVSKDFTAKLVFNEARGIYDVPVQVEKKVRPTYLWFNGQSNKEVHPQGSRNDPQAKIYPFKRFVGTVPGDAESKEPIPLKLGILFTKGDLAAAIAKGIEESKFKYSGKWVPVQEVIYYQASHGITVERALRCADCHVANGALDFKALGYSEEEIKKLTQPR